MSCSRGNVCFIPFPPRRAFGDHLFQVPWQPSYKAECVSALRCCIAESNECCNVDGTVCQFGPVGWPEFSLFHCIFFILGAF